MNQKKRSPALAGNRAEDKSLTQNTSIKRSFLEKVTDTDLTP